MSSIKKAIPLYILWLIAAINLALGISTEINVFKFLAFLSMLISIIYLVFIAIIIPSYED